MTRYIIANTNNIIAINLSNMHERNTYCAKGMPGIPIVQKLCQEYLLCKRYVKNTYCAKGMPGIPIVKKVCQEYLQGIVQRVCQEYLQGIVQTVCQEYLQGIVQRYARNICKVGIKHIKHTPDIQYSTKHILSQFTIFCNTSQ